jgi:hypothetical protein
MIGINFYYSIMEPFSSLIQDFILIAVDVALLGSYNVNSKTLAPLCMYQGGPYPPKPVFLPKYKPIPL